MPTEHRGCRVCGEAIEATGQNTFATPQGEPVSLCDACKRLVSTSCESLGLGTPEPIGDLSTL